MSEHLKGVMLAVLGVLVLTPDTLIIRLVDLNPWSFLFWRGAFYFLGMTAIVVLMHRRRFFHNVFAIGVLGCWIMVVHTLVNVGFQISVQTTTVANTLVIIATSPMFAAIFGWLLMRELVPRRTWIAILMCLTGIVVIFAGQLDSITLVGDLLAVGAAAGLGIQFVLVRLAAPTDMIPAIALSGLLTACVGLVMGPDLYLAPDKLYLTAFLGIILLPAAMALLTIALRHAPAAEVSLIILLETVLGPLWVWLGVGEEAPPQTLIGGAIVLATLAAHTIAGARAERH